MPNLRRAFFAAICLFIACAARLPAARAPYDIKTWDNKDGLPQSSVIAMTQTRDGYLWLGTLDGLARFDGMRFTVFNENNTPGLESSRIVSLFEDSRSNLWIGTEKEGVALLKDGRVTHLGIGRGAREGRLTAACEDEAGAVWLYTADGRLWRFRDGATNVFLPGTDRFSVEHSSANRATVREKSGRVRVGVEGGFTEILPPAAFGPGRFPLEMETPGGWLEFLLLSEHGGWRLGDGLVQRWTTNGVARNLGPTLWNARLTPVTAACEDREGNLIVGTLGAGLFWYDALGKATGISTNDGLSYNYILSLHVDREGSLWVGTDGGGLNRVKREVFRTLEPTRGLVVQSVAETGQGQLWMGFNAVGLSVLGAGLWNGVELRRFGQSDGLLNSSVAAVFVDRSQQVWAGQGAGLYQWQVPSNRFQSVPVPDSLHSAVQAMHEDRRGRLWVGTQTGLGCREDGAWKVFTRSNGLPAESVRALAEDAEGNLWIGTERGGLHRLRDGQFTVFRKKDGLPGDDISSLFADTDGTLWIGTTGGGLARWRQGRSTVYSTREGLVGSSVGFLLDDAQGHLWIGSSAGLMRARKQVLNDFAEGRASAVSFRVYRESDGLPSGECTRGSQPGACRARDGTLWFPTTKGLASVDPARLRPNTNPPPVLIESLLIAGEPLGTNGPLARLPSVVTIPPGRERIEIHYTSLNLAAPEQARFKYRMEGHETAWTDAGEIRVAHYPKLPPGRYRFQVTACNEDGVWNDAGASLAFVQQPPFWLTWWFLTLAAAALLAAIAGGVHYVSTQKLLRQLALLRQQEALEKERARIARDIHDQLGASLTQVALLGELVEGDKDCPGEVEAHGRQISQTAHDTSRALDQIVWTVNPSNDTLEGLVNYVCKYAQEYLAVAGLRYRLDAPAQLPDAAISPEVRHNIFLASKEAVTNVVRHAQAKSVWLRLKLQPEGFTLEIQDDGRGPAGLEEKRAQSRNGVRNMGKRMEDVGGRFEIARAPEGGTIVRLTAPFARG